MKTVRLPRRSIAKRPALTGCCTLLLFGAVVAVAHADDHRGNDRRPEDRRADDGRGFGYHPGYHGGPGYGGYYAPPPVAYGGPYYPPPPVVYGPGIGINLPGVSINLR